MNGVCEEGASQTSVQVYGYFGENIVYKGCD